MFSSLVGLNEIKFKVSVISDTVPGRRWPGDYPESSTGLAECYLVFRKTSASRLQTLQLANRRIPFWKSWAATPQRPGALFSIAGFHRMPHRAFNPGRQGDTMKEDFYNVA